MFLVLRISKNWHFLIPLPPYKCWRNIWMVPNVDSFHTNFINTTFQKKPQSSLNKFYETEISPLMQFSLHFFLSTSLQFLVNTTFSLIGTFPRTKRCVNQGVYSKMDLRMIFNKTWFSLVCATEGRVTGRRSTLDWLMTDNQLLVLSFSIGLQWARIISGWVF